MAMNFGVVEGWEQLPRGLRAPRRRGRGGGRRGRVFLICRGDHPVIVYDQKGNFLRSWGEGDFTYRTHGITIGPDEYGLLHGRRQPHRAEVHARRQAPDDARHHEHAVGHRLRRQGLDQHPARGRPLQPADQPGRRAEGRSLRLRRLRQLPRAPVLAHRASSSSPGACPGRAPASSTCRTASPWPRTAASSSATARTTASRSSAPTASTCPSGPTRSGPPTSCSTPRAAPTSPSSGGTRARRPSATGRSTSPGYGRVSVFDRDGKLLARWGSADARRGGQLRRAARPRGGLARRRLRERGDLDLRGEPRARARGLPHLPEVRGREELSGDRRRHDPASLDAQDPGPSLALRRGAGHRPRGGRLGVDRARQEADGRVRRPRRRQRGARSSRDRRGRRRADGAPRLLPDHAAVLQPARRRARGQARRAHAGRPHVLDVRGERLRGQRARRCRSRGTTGWPAGARASTR